MTASIGSSKWLKGIAADAPATRAARAAIADRLGAVWSLAPLAAYQAEEDSEYVHQLRVATRRARAAMEVFREMLPDRGTRWVRKRLRSLRQAAGKARDLDVLGARLRSELPRGGDSGRAAILSLLDAERRDAQVPLREAVDELRRKDFAGRAETLTGRVAWHGQDPEPDYRELAETHLTSLGTGFIEAAVLVPGDIESMHRMRIAGKRLRYAIELLAAPLPKAVRQEIYPQLSSIQTRLGDIHDHAVAAQLLADLAGCAKSKPARAALRRLSGSESDQSCRELADLIDWWTPDRADRFRADLLAAATGNRG